MMAGSYSISVDLPNAGNMLFARDALPNLAHAVGVVTESAMQLWQAYAAGLPMPNGMRVTNRTGEYQRSIMVRQLGDFAAEVYSDLPYARAIEDGSPARDMHDMLNYSLKVRLTKDGKRYLIIPFRHNTPGATIGANMPESVATWWRGKAASHVVSEHTRVSGTGAYDIRTRAPATVAAWKYQWGDRLSKRALQGLGITGTSAKRLEGMVHFRNPGGSAPAKGSHGQYITFRVMAEGSKGWRVGAQAGKFPAKQVADQIRPEAEKVFAEALAQDIAAAVGGVVKP